MNNPFAFLWSVIKEYKYTYLLLTIAPLADGIYPLMYNYAVKLLIDLFTQHGNISFAQSIPAIGLFISAQIILDGSWHIHNFAELKCMPHILQKIMNKICQHCFNLSYNFFQSNFSGSVTAKIKGIGDNYLKIHKALDHGLSTPFFITIFSGAALAMTNLKIFLFIFVFIIFYSPITFHFFSKMAKIEQEKQDSWYYFFGTVADRITNIFTIFSFATKHHELEKIDEYYTSVHSPILTKYYRYNFIAYIILCLIHWIFLISLFCYVIYMHNNGELSIGDIAFIMSMTLSFSDNSWLTALQLKDLLEDIATFRSAFTIMQISPCHIDKPGSPKINIAKGEITFRDVSFKYEESGDVLKNLNFEIKPGEKIGIVGSSGTGKSTLVSLLLKNFKAESGDILVDGQSIYETSSESLREKISLIPQDVILFHRSIGENIGYGKENASQYEIEKAAKAAKIHEFIQTMPEKYDTLVGERGIKLSGGQRQRIAIARAMLKDAPILILDEATSALDSETEREIQKSINLMLTKKNLTVIAIAHRLSTIRNLDRIIVMEDGHIIESGNFADLISIPEGRFKSLWQHQTL